MKKIINVISIILIIILIFSLQNKSCEASHSASEIVSEGEKFINIGKDKAEKDNIIPQENLKQMSNTVYNILLVTGIIIAIIIGLILGIKFITGGIEGQAEVQKMLIPYIVGCVVIFGAFTIWKIVVDILQSF